MKYVIILYEYFGYNDYTVYVHICQVSGMFSVRRDKFDVNNNVKHNIYGN
jgi:hypothetical protein